MRKAGIVGLGLIGGSMAKALRKYGGVTDITAYGRNVEALASAVRDGTVTRYTTAIDASFAGCEIVFVCTPVDTVPTFVHMLGPIVGGDCIITDVGSTKSGVCQALADMTDLCFIGGHPMAGSEKTGYAASFDFLFENAYYLLTPYPHTPADKIQALQALVAQIGAIPVVLPPKPHDHAVAAVSHTPHVVAAALVNAVRLLDDASGTAHTLAAGGFKDITRIASSSPDIWQSISFENKAEILAALAVFETQLRQFKDYLTQDDADAVRGFYNDAKTYRDSFLNTPGYMKTYTLFVDVLDVPGSIATVTTHLSFNGINIKNIGVVNNREFENGVLQIVVATEADRAKSAALLRSLNLTVYE